MAANGGQVLTTVWKQLAMPFRSAGGRWPRVERSELRMIWGISVEILL